MSITQEQAQWFQASFARLVANVEQAILGKTYPVRLALTCLLSGGHLLLEDMPGTGKTSLAKAIAKTVDSTYRRIQFTPDLLPSDLIGSNVFDQRTGQWVLRKGPAFTTVLLADEINRASPKTQSALLEVMEERIITIDGVDYPPTDPDPDHPGPLPFIVIATQNPIEQAGTYPLPEAQLDRFLMRTKLGYPDRPDMVRLLYEDEARRDRTDAVRPVIKAFAVVSMANLANTVHVDPSVMDYVARIAEYTRAARHVLVGVSARGCLALVRAAKTWAAADGRVSVTPADVKELAIPVLEHRIVLDPDAEFARISVRKVITDVLNEVAPPTDRMARPNGRTQFDSQFDGGAPLDDRTQAPPAQRAAG